MKSSFNCASGSIRNVYVRDDAAEQLNSKGKLWELSRRPERRGAGRDGDHVTVPVRPVVRAGDAGKFDRRDERRDGHLNDASAGAVESRIGVIRILEHGRSWREK